MAASKPPKGCYNCMKRRIICDRTEPHCLKCQKKGLECPGLGIRYRFSDGIATRGKFKGKTYNVQSDQGPTKAGESTCTAPKQFRWVASRSINKSASLNNDALSPIPATRSIILPASDGGHLTCAQQKTKDDQDVIELPMLTPCIELIDAKTRHLFTHFADYVSPVMILSDGITNGYRHHVLPMAVNDVIVQRAVCVTSTFHLSIKRPELRQPAEAGRAAIIRKLKEMACTQQVFTLSTWTTIVLLFVGELVAGSEDILILYRMLMSFVGARNSSAETSPLESFLNQQTKIIQFFTRPSISETDGIEELLAAPSPNPGELEWPDPPIFTPEYFNEAYRQASAIYIFRAQSEFINIADPFAIKLVARLKDFVANVDPNAAGAHTLVWPYFVAAAESILPEHRNFFYQRLNHIWETTRYRNVKIGMDALEQIWAQRGKQRWTAMLPDIAMVVM